jgi:hypothetical protein
VSILIQAGNDVNAYFALVANGDVPLPRICPVCAGHLHGHGWCHRQVVAAEEAVELPVRRVKCSACGQTHVCLPHFLVPRRIFALPVIEAQVGTYLFTQRSLRQVAADGFGGEPPYQRLWGWVQRLGALAGKVLEHLQAVLTSLDPSGELSLSLPVIALPTALADRKTRTSQTRQRFLDAWRVLTTTTRLAAVAAARQIRGPQASGEYLAWAGWVLAKERGPSPLSSHTAFA